MGITGASKEIAGMRSHIGAVPVSLAVGVGVGALVGVDGEGVRVGMPKGRGGVGVRADGSVGVAVAVTMSIVLAVAIAGTVVARGNECRRLATYSVRRGMLRMRPSVSRISPAAKATLVPRERSCSIV